MTSTVKITNDVEGSIAYVANINHVCARDFSVLMAAKLQEIKATHPDIERIHTLMTDELAISESILNDPTPDHQRLYFGVFVSKAEKESHGILAWIVIDLTARTVEDHTSNLITVH